MNQLQQTTQKDQFIMSPKVDFAFKLLFGDEKNKDLLIALLSSILKMPIEEFEGLQLLNTELLREFKEDKKGILDVRVRLKNGEQIDIEIQILPTKYMPERTMFYWSKMFVGQIQAGDTYKQLKKCITINIVDFEYVKGNKIHTQYHVTEDELGCRLTEALEIHFLEIPKLEHKEKLKDGDDSIIEWLEFLNAKSREVMQVLAEKNDKIAKAYTILEVMSQDRVARMAYEAREAEIRDQLTREEEAREAIEEGIQKGIQQGIEQGKIDMTRKMLEAGMEVAQVQQISGLSLEQIEQLKK